MNDAFNHPQSVVVLGGTSEIAGRIGRSSGGRSMPDGRAGGEGLRGAGPRGANGPAEMGRTTVKTVVFDALDLDYRGRHRGVFEAAGDNVDLVLITLGLLGDAATDVMEAGRIAENITVNFAWPAAALGSVARRLRDRATGGSSCSRLSPGSGSVGATSSTGPPSLAWTGTPLGLAETLRGIWCATAEWCGQDSSAPK